MARNDTITTKFAVDVSDLKKGISEANQAMKLANAQFKASTAGMEDWRKAAEGIRAKLAQLDSVLSAQKTKLSAYQQELERNQKAYKENGERAAQLRAKLEELASQGVSKTSAEYKRYEAALASTEKEQERNRTAIDKLNLEILKEQANVGATEKEIGKYTKSLDDLENGTDDAAEETEDFGDEVEDAGKKAEDSSKGYTVLKGVLANLATKGIELVVDGLKKMGKAFVQTIQDVAAAGDEIQKNSQKVGLSYEAYQKWDYAMKIAGTEMSSMNTGLKTLTNKFDDALNGSKSATEQFNRLGLSMSDIKGLSREELFGTVIQQLQGIEDETTKAALANDFFGKSGQDLIPLLNQSAEATQELLEQAEQYGLVLSDDAVNASADFQDSLTLLQSSLTATKNNIVSQFLPAATDLMKGFAGIVAGVDGAEDQLRAGASAFVKQITKALPQVVTVVENVAGAIIEVLPQLTSELLPRLLGMVPTLISAISSILPRLIQSVTQAIVQSAPQILTSVLSMATSVISQLGTIIPMIVTELVSMLPQISQAILDAAPALMTALFSLVESLYTMLPTVTPLIVSFVIQLIQQAGKFIVENAPILLEAWLRALTAMLDALPMVLEQLSAMLPMIIDTVISFFGDNIDLILDAAFQAFMAIVRAIPKILTSLGNALKSILTALKNILIEPAKKFFFGMWENIKKIFSGVGTWFKTKWTDAWNSIKEAFGKIGEWFSEKWQAVKDIFGKVGEWFGEKFGEAWTNIKEKFSKFGEFFSNLWDSVKTKFSELGTKIGDSISGAVKAGINGIIRSIENIINNGINLINGAIKLINLIPGVSIGSLNRLSLPRLEHGGVLRKGQIGLLEGSGAEAVVPLDKNKKWISAVAGDMLSQLRGTGTVNNVRNDNNYSFTQIINAPKAPSRIELYRQTRNLLAYAKEGV